MDGLWRCRKLNRYRAVHARLGLAVVHNYAAVFTRVTETFTRYPRAPSNRISRSHSKELLRTQSTKETLKTLKTVLNGKWKLWRIRGVLHHRDVAGGFLFGRVMPHAQVRKYWSPAIEGINSNTASFPVPYSDIVRDNGHESSSRDYLPSCIEYRNPGYPGSPAGTNGRRNLLSVSHQLGKANAFGRWHGKRGSSVCGGICHVSREYVAIGFLQSTPCLWTPVGANAGTTR